MLCHVVFDASSRDSFSSVKHCQSTLSSYSYCKYPILVLANIQAFERCHAAPQCSHISKAHIYASSLLQEQFLSTPNPLSPYAPQPSSKPPPPPPTDSPKAYGPSPSPRRETSPVVPDLPNTFWRAGTSLLGSAAPSHGRRSS